MSPVLIWGPVFAALVIVLWLVCPRRPRRPAPPAQPVAAHDEIPGRYVRPLHEWDRRLLGHVGGAWEDLELAGVADRGQAIADLGRSRSSATDSDLAGELFRIAHSLTTIITGTGDPEGHYWPVILELGAACRDLTELDYAEGGVKP